MIRPLALAVALGLLPIAASAQTIAASASSATALDAAVADQSSQGPMTVERVHDGFMVAPDFKFSEIDHHSAGLAGAYAGFVLDEHFFIGGGGYGLVAHRDGRDLAYGGLMLQWFGGDDVFGFGAKLLLGGGNTAANGTLQVIDPHGGQVVNESVRVHQNFGVAEPELDALVHLAPYVRLSVGAGYRFTGENRFDPAFLPGTRLDGAVGSVSLQIGGGR